MPSELNPQSLPEAVLAARGRAAEIGFELSSDDLAGRVLEILAAAVPLDGCILEIGTGTGVGTAWLLAGIAQLVTTCQIIIIPSG
jgi:predicted O-methyltransferase YrrM